MTLLKKKIDIGTLGCFGYGTRVMMFGFMQSLTHLIVTPISHRNINQFMGIRVLNDYVCYRVLKDNFIALTYRVKLSTWKS